MVGITPQLCVCRQPQLLNAWVSRHTLPPSCCRFYAPQLFQAAGQGADAALLSTVITGAVNVGSTVVAILLVDRLGRRFLFLQGGVQMILCEVRVLVEVCGSRLEQGGAAAAWSVAASSSHQCVCSCAPAPAAPPSGCQVAVGVLLKFDFEQDAMSMIYAGPVITLICLYVVSG